MTIKQDSIESECPATIIMTTPFGLGEEANEVEGT